MFNKFYVYALVDPNTDNPFYIGKGCGKREISHIKESHQLPETWTNSLKCRRILAIEKTKKKVLIKRLYDNLSEQDAYQKEIHEIKKWGKIIDGTGCLTNISDGGEGGSGQGEPVCCYSKTGRLIQRFKTLADGAVYADIHLSTLCSALNNRSKTAGGYRWAYEGDNINLEPLRSISPVIKYDLDGNKIKEYTSINEAAQDIKITFTSIVETCTGKHETAGGFRWSYAGQKLKPLKRSVNWYKKKKYQAIDKNNKIVGTFNTIKEAVQKTKANSTGIVDCCAGRKKTSGGLKWQCVYV